MIKNQNITHYLFAGDYCLSGPRPNECNGIPIHMAHSSVAFVGPYPFSKWNSVLVAQRNLQPGTDPKKILVDIEKWSERKN